MPLVVVYMVHQEKHFSISEHSRSCLVKYISFMIVYIFLVPLLGMQVIEIGTMIYEENWEEWQKDVGLRVSSSGFFYCSFIIHQTYISTGLDLLQLP